MRRISAPNPATSVALPRSGQDVVTLGKKPRTGLDEIRGNAPANNNLWAGLKERLVMSHGSVLRSPSRSIAMNICPRPERYGLRCDSVTRKTLNGKRIRYAVGAVGALAVVSAFLAACGCAPIAWSGEAVLLYGKPEVMEFRDGKVAAFSMQFDDSMETHAKFVIPELNERGLVGTFFINPGRERYQKNKQ